MRRVNIDWFSDSFVSRGSARHGFLYMSEDRDSDLLKTMAVMANRAEKKGKLRKEPQAV